MVAEEQLGATGPSTDLSAAQQPAGTTRVEDGVAYDVSGKPLGKALEDQHDLSAGMAPKQSGELDLSSGMVSKQNGGMDLSAGMIPKSSASRPGFGTGLAESYGIPTTSEDLKAAAKAAVPTWHSALFGPAGDAAQGLWGYATRVAGNLHDDVKEEYEAGSNIAHGEPIGQNLGKAGFALAHGVIANLPFVGEPLEKAGTEAIPQGNYAYAGGLLIGAASQILLPELIGKYMEAHPTQAKIKANALKVAVDDHAAHASVHQTAVGDLDTASAQVNEARSRVQRAQENETAGQGTRQQTVDAKDNLSQATANLQKSHGAVLEAQANKAEAAVKVEKAQRDIVNAATPKPKVTKIGTPKEIAKSTEDFQKAIPSGPGKSAYTPEDLKAVRPVLENSHLTDAAVNSPEAVYDAVENQRQKMSQGNKAAIKLYENEPLKLTGDDGAPTSVKQKLVEALKEQEAVRPGFTEKALGVLDDFNLTDPSVGEADKIREQLNTENRTKLQTNHWSIMDAVDSDPEFAAKYELQGIMRDGVYDLMGEKGVPGIRERRQLEASMIRVRNAADRMIPKSESTVRGTETPGRFRKVAAWGVKKSGIGVGAALAGMTGIPGAAEAGAYIGNTVSGKLGDIISPGARTRSQLIQDSMAVRHTDAKVPQIDMTGAQPSNPPAFPLPPEHEIPANPRENTQLHSDLSSHYDESVGDTPYQDLEDRFLSDVKIKKKYGVPLDVAEKKLNRGINESRIEEAKAARGQTDAQIKAAEKAQVEADRAAAETEQEKKEKEASGLKMNVRAPFETEDHLEVPDFWKALGKDGYKTGTHELGHHFQIAKYEHPTEDIISHLHDKLDEGALAEARWDTSNFQDGNGEVDYNKIHDNLDQLLDIFHGGAVAEEVVHGTPVYENYGAQTDLARAKRWALKAGYTDSDVGQMMSASETRVRKDFTQPGVRDIFERYTKSREKGLNPKLLMSEETSGRAIQEFKNALESNNEPNDNKQAVTGRNVRSAREGNAGREGRGAGKNKGAAGAASPSGEGAGARGVGERGLETNIKSPPMRSTGVPAHDEAIKAGGGIPGGVMDLGEHGKISMFHDPGTGTTLGFKGDEEVTPEAVKAKLAESRKRYSLKTEIAAPAEASKYHPDLQKVIDQNELVDKIPQHASFITPDGKFVKLGESHPEAIEMATGRDFNDISHRIANEEDHGQDNRVKFLNDTGAIRTRLRQTQAGNELVASVPKQGVTQEQINALKQSVGRVRDGSLVIERSDVTPETKGVLSKQKDFPRQDDVDSMMRDIQAHPEQVSKQAATPDWANKASETAATQGGGFTINPRTAETPTDGHMGEIYPEGRKTLDHPATADDIRAFHQEHKDLFDKHPELQVGGYGNELNISANGADRAAAEGVAKKLDQISIYDVKNKKRNSNWRQEPANQFP